MAIDIVQWLVDGFQNFVTIVLPWLIIVTIVLLIGYVVSRVARAITIRLIVRFRVEEALTRAGVGDMVRSVGFVSVASFFGALVFWFLFLMFVLLALGVAPTPSLPLGLDTLLTDIARFIPSVIAAALIVVAGVWVGTWFAERIDDPKIKTEIPFPPEIVGGIVKFIAVAIAGIIALNLLLGPANVAILTFAVSAAIAALALGLGISLAWGSRNLAENLSGYLQVSQSLKPGDRVEIGQRKGTVREVNRYAVVLEDASGREVSIPNGQVVRETVIKTAGGS